MRLVGEDLLGCQKSSTVAVSEKMGLGKINWLEGDGYGKIFNGSRNHAAGMRRWTAHI